MKLNNNLTRLSSYSSMLLILFEINSDEIVIVTDERSLEERN